MNAYGAATDPMPYLVASYLLGLVLIGGYSGWIWLHRKRVQKYLAAIQDQT